MAVRMASASCNLSVLRMPSTVWIYDFLSDSPISPATLQSGSILFWLNTRSTDVVAILEIGVELAAQSFVDGARVDFVHQVNHVLFQCANVGKPLVDALLHIVFHTVAHML